MNPVFVVLVKNINAVVELYKKTNKDNNKITPTPTTDSIIFFDFKIISKLLILDSDPLNPSILLKNPLCLPILPHGY